VKFALIFPDHFGPELKRRKNSTGLLNYHSILILILSANNVPEATWTGKLDHTDVILHCGEPTISFRWKGSWYSLILNIFTRLLIVIDT
jgi:hypothetical protein